MTINNDVLILLNHVVGKYAGQVMEATMIENDEVDVTVAVPPNLLLAQRRGYHQMLSHLRQAMLHFPTIAVDAAGYQGPNMHEGTQQTHKIFLRLREVATPPARTTNEEEIYESSPMGKPHSKDGSGVGRWEFKMRHKDNSTLHVYDRPKHVRGSDTEPRFLIRHTAASGAHLGSAFTHTHVEAHKRLKEIVKHGRLRD